MGIFDNLGGIGGVANYLSPGVGEFMATGNVTLENTLDPGGFFHNTPLGGKKGKGNPVTSPTFSVDGGDFGSYSSLPGLDLEHYGVLPQQNIGFANAARSILGGSQRAQKSLQSQYAEQYRHAAEGVAAGQSEYRNRMGGEVAAQGYSPDLVRRMLLGSDRQSQAQIGALHGEAQAGYFRDLAQLQKGTATEMAGLQTDELQMVVEAYNAKKGIGAAADAGKTGAIGSGIGAAAGVIGSLFSDRRLKQNVVATGATHEGIPIVEFEYVPEFEHPGRFRGVLAQDVQALRPDCVREAGCFLLVDYDRLGLECVKVG
jgi:hypothetical protein